MGSKKRNKPRKATRGARRRAALARVGLKVVTKRHEKLPLALWTSYDVERALTAPGNVDFTWCLTTREDKMTLVEMLRELQSLRSFVAHTRAALGLLK